MTKQAISAKEEWMSRDNFRRFSPWGIQHDVCSEGLTDNDLKEIFCSVASDLRLLAELYSAASVELSDNIANKEIV